MKNYEEDKMVARMDREREGKLNRAKAKGRVPPPVVTHSRPKQKFAPVTPEAIHHMAVAALSPNRR